jgi:hypothetical protein
MMMNNKKKEQRMAGDRMAFGAGNITGPGEERRQPEQVQIGDPHGQGQMMPQDLAGGYLNLAIPGSPLGQMGLMSGITARNAQITQDAIQAQQLQQLMAMQAMRGQLPVGMMPQQQQG